MSGQGPGSMEQMHIKRQMWSIGPVCPMRSKCIVQRMKHAIRRIPSLYSVPPMRPSLILVLCACSGQQSALDAAGAQAASVAGLWWTMLAVSSAIVLLVTAFVLTALFRKRRDDEDMERQDRSSGRVVVASAVLTVLILLGTFLYSMVVSRAAAALETDGAQEIRIVGQQWWWDITYTDSIPARSFRTANELHLPAGESVVLRLSSIDVIHSFWVPNLHGKLDLVPGRVNTLWIRAERPGRYRGQCAEFCGLQHAKMAFDVVVHEPEEFQRWKEQQQQPAAEPADSLTLRGREVFLGTACATCHTVRGTPAWAAAGPDLTHVASRLSLGAGSVPNTRGHLAGWIADPQGMKPGNRMPRVPLDAADMTALLAYLASLR